MSKHRRPGFQLPRVLPRPWMWALATLGWATGAGGGAVHELPVLGICVCIGFAVLCAWLGGRHSGEETAYNYMEESTDG